MKSENRIYFKTMMPANKNSPKTLYDAIIIGAGAAGLMCAAVASQRKKSVLVLENNERPGKKILISGGGRCNFTNLNVAANHYVSQNPHFCKSALNQFKNHDFLQWVKRHKIKYYEKTLGQLFCTHSSKYILEMLLNEIDSHYGHLICKQQVQSVKKQNNQFCVKTQDQEFYSKQVVVAAGGLSFPKLGATALGYKIAESFGHSQTPLHPALDAFVLPKKFKKFCQFSGVSLKAKLTTCKNSFEENILFTHFGISGPAALKTSLYWLENKPVTLNFFPEILALSQFLMQQKENDPKMKLQKWLKTKFPNNFAEFLSSELEIENLNFADLSKKKILALESYFQNFSFTPASTVGYSKAEVTRGGINTNELESKTMRSKIDSDLFFIGEVVDVTGLLGGYNFQWAWSSGWVAGQNIK